MPGLRTKASILGLNWHWQSEDRWRAPLSLYNWCFLMELSGVAIAWLDQGASCPRSVQLLSISHWGVNLVGLAFNLSFCQGKKG